MRTLKDYPKELLNSLTIQELWDKLAEIDRESIREDYKYTDYYDIRDAILREIIRKEEEENS